LGEGNVAAVAPTSAMICCAESTPSPRDLGEAVDRVVVDREQIGHLLLELSEVILDHAQLVQRELHQPAVDRMQRRHASKASHSGDWRRPPRPATA